MFSRYSLFVANSAITTPSSMNVDTIQNLFCLDLRTWACDLCSSRTDSLFSVIILFLLYNLIFYKVVYG